MPPVIVNGDGSVTGLLAIDTPRYANAVARDAMVTSTVGKLVFMEDTGLVNIYNGTGWVVA